MLFLVCATNMSKRARQLSTHNRIGCNKVLNVHVNLICTSTSASRFIDRKREDPHRNVPVQGQRCFAASIC